MHKCSTDAMGKAPSNDAMYLTPLISFVNYLTLKLLCECSFAT